MGGCLAGFRSICIYRSDPTATGIPKSKSQMYNDLFAVDLPMRLAGKKLPAILADTAGGTERTWRNRLTKSWNPSSDDIAAVQGHHDRFITEKLTKHKWSEDEVSQILARRPSRKAGSPRPTADLICWTSPRFGEGYEAAIEIACQFDCLCADLCESFEIHDVPRYRQAILNVSRWLRESMSNDDAATDFESFDVQVRRVDSLFELKRMSDKISDDMLFHVLSSWDLVFCSAYFNGKLKATPLFRLVMPGWAPGVDFDEESGRIQRNGATAKGRIFEKSASKLFDFLAVLIHWHKFGKPPNARLQVRDMATWFDEPESRLVSWRDETTRFTMLQFEDLWVRAVGSGGAGKSAGGHTPGVPKPMLVASQLWGRLLERENGQERSCIFCVDPYLAWWQRNLARMKSKGVPYGDIPLPSCLTD